MIKMKTVLESIFLILAVIGMTAMDSEGIGLIIAIIMMFSGFIGIFIMENVYISPRHHKHKKYTRKGEYKNA
jgi:uncharacterized membrane-anchored protein